MGGVAYGLSARRLRPEPGTGPAAAEKLLPVMPTPPREGPAPPNATDPFPRERPTTRPFLKQAWRNKQQQQHPLPQLLKKWQKR